MTYYRRNGTRIIGELTVEEHIELFSDNNRRVDLTILWWGGTVSTVFLCIDHSYGDSKPLLFETMVFPKSSYYDLDMERYSTEDEARAGHKEMVRKWKNPLFLTTHVCSYYWSEISSFVRRLFS